MAELWLEAGTSFDLEIVQVMASMPAAVLMRPPAATDAGAGSASKGGALVPFRGRGRDAERSAAS
jgi:hypothetical protein